MKKRIIKKICNSLWVIIINKWKNLKNTEIPVKTVIFLNLKTKMLKMNCAKSLISFDSFTFVQFLQDHGTIVHSYTVGSKTTNFFDPENDVIGKIRENCVRRNSGCPLYCSLAAFPTVTSASERLFPVLLSPIRI